MAQFDVLQNLGRQKDAIPFVVVVQSSQFDDFRRRVVVPLVRASALSKTELPRFNPSFKIRGVAVVLHPLEIASVAVSDLGSKVVSLSADGERIVAALDELFSRAWK
jgi:toxin CcdB